MSDFSSFGAVVVNEDHKSGRPAKCNFPKTEWFKSQFLKADGDGKMNGQLACPQELRGTAAGVAETQLKAYISRKRVSRFGKVYWFC